MQLGAHLRFKKINMMLLRSLHSPSRMFFCGFTATLAQLYRKMHRHDYGNYAATFTT